MHVVPDILYPILHSLLHFSTPSHPLSPSHFSSRDRTPAHARMHARLRRVYAGCGGATSSEQGSSWNVVNSGEPIKVVHSDQSVHE